MVLCHYIKLLKIDFNLLYNLIHLVMLSVRNVGKRFFSSNLGGILNIKLTEQFNHNLKFIDNIEIQMYNPSLINKNAIFRTHTFESRVYMVKDSIRLTKQFKSDNYNDLIEQINTFINNEIKI